MTDEISFKIDEKDLDDLIGDLNKAGAEIGQKAYSKAIRSGSNKIKESVKSNINTKNNYVQIGDFGERKILQKRTGRLIKSITIRNITKYQPYFWKAVVLSKRGRDRNDPAGAYWAHMLEFGHKTIGFGGKQGYSAPKSFMKKGIEDVQDSVLREFISETRAALDKFWKK